MHKYLKGFTDSTGLHFKQDGYCGIFYLKLGVANDFFCVSLLIE